MLAAADATLAAACCAQHARSAQRSWLGRSWWIVQAACMNVWLLPCPCSGMQGGGHSYRQGGYRQRPHQQGEAGSWVLAAAPLSQAMFGGAGAGHRFALLQLLPLLSTRGHATELLSTPRSCCAAQPLQGMFLSRGQDPIIASIEQRIAKWTLMPVGPLGRVITCTMPLLHERIALGRSCPWVSNGLAATGWVESVVALYCMSE